MAADDPPPTGAGPMTAADRMRYHLAEMQRWQAQVTQRELVRRKAVQAELDRSNPLGTPLEYAVAEDLSNDFWYGRACSARNGHQQAALTYGIAALVDADTTVGSAR